jgi:hypothetical protein
MMAHGGARQNAGRKSELGPDRVNIPVAFSGVESKEIDLWRGPVSRSAFIRSIVMHYIQKKEKTLMAWNSEQGAYFGTTSNNETVRVEGDEMAEALQEAGVHIDDAIQQGRDDLLNADMWAELAGVNQNVSIVG